MATLPADRSKLALAQSNQVPSVVASSTRNINAMTEAYDTIDLLNSKVNTMVSESTLSALGVINVKDYNASGSAQTTTGSITTGTNRLTVASAIDFAVGQGISIAGAGAAGVALVTTIANISNLVLTLADNASTTVAAATIGHEDTVAITNALTALNTAGGGKLIFPVGTYTANQLPMYDDVIVEGSGWDTIIQHRLTTVTTDSLFNIVGNDGDGDTSQNIKNFVIRDIQLKSTVDVDGFSEFNHLLRMYGVSNVLIENVKFYGFRGDAIVASYGGIGAFYHNENITIRNCYIDGVNNDNRNAISISDVNGLMIDNNVIVNTTKSTMPGAIDLEPNSSDYGIILKNITISNNELRNIGGNVAAICMYLPIDSDSFTEEHPSNITIENNSMDGVTIGIYLKQLQTVALTDDSEGSNIKVLNNKVKNASDRSMWIYGLKDITFRDNLFEESANGSRIGFTSAIHKCVNVKLINNVIRRSGTTDGLGISIYSVGRLDIIDNVFDDIGLAAGSFGVCLAFSTGTSSFVRIIRNTSIEPTGRITGDITKAAGHTFTPAGNVQKENTFATTTNEFVADLKDFGNTSSTFTGATLPDSFVYGTTKFLVASTTGMPVGFSEGTIVTEKHSPFTTGREYITQIYYPKNSGGASLTDFYKRCSEDATNTWGAWHKFVGTAVANN